MLPITAPLTFSLSQAALWMAERPAVARIVMIVLPLAVAVVAAALAHAPAYACPAGSTACGTGG